MPPLHVESKPGLEFTTSTTSFPCFDAMVDLTTDDVRKLLEQFAATSFKSKDSEKSADNVQEKCIKLFLKDYPDSGLISNQNGELSTSYPSTLIVPVASSHRSRASSDSFSQFELVPGLEATENGCRSSPFDTSAIDTGQLRDLMMKARVARCRARFPVPVILVDNKYVCRSATLSGGPEIYGRSGFDLLFSNVDEEGLPSASSMRSSSGSVSSQNSLPTLSNLSLGDSSHVFSKVRTQDINLLKCLGVKYICDLMVEKKKVKFGLNITSSEKADKESRYNDFEILSLPYPGCEFFRDYRDKGYAAEGLVFDWSQNFVDAILDVPDDYYKAGDIKWTEYKSWDIINLTMNYLKLLINLLSDSDSSLLIHCISGWDRTPLFISLLRLSLWADGKIHQSLTALEITYLTLAYDWYLFGHNLNDRITKGEEILFFCFYFLKFITSDDFNFYGNKHRSFYRALNSPVNSRLQSNSEANGSNPSLESNLEDSLVEENGTSPAGYHLGSCTSLNSTSSIGSNRSQNECNPPTTFPCSSGSSESAASFFCLKSPVSNSSYPNTPPTLTNSEEGSNFLNCDCIDGVASPIPRRVSRNGSGVLNTVDEDPDSSETLTGSPKTIPMPIPRNGAEGRKISIGDEAWQMVSETGSIKDNVSTKGFVLYSSPDSQGDATSSNNHHHQQAVKVPLKKTWSINRQRQLARRERLQAVRSLFYNTYSTVIGFRFKNNGTEPTNSSNLSSLLYQHLGVGPYSGRVTAPN